MSDQLPLPQLEDIVLPPAVPFWPPAPGWWMLAVLILVILITTTTLMIRHRQRNRWKREALAMLTRISNQTDSQRALRELRELLKQVARLRYPTAGTDRLSGDAWLNFLGNSHGGPDAWRPLIESAWKPITPPTVPTQVELVRHWLKVLP